MAAPAPLSPLAPKKYPTLPAIEGVRFATVAAGVRYAGRTDVMLALFDAPADGRRRVHALEMPLGAGRLVPRPARRAARRARWSSIPATPTPSPARSARARSPHVGEAVAKATGAAPSEVFMASTGVIGEPLEPSRIARALDDARRRRASPTR